MRAVLDRLRGLLGLGPARRQDEPAVPAPPSVQVVLAGAVPAALVRLLPGALVLGCAALVASGPLSWVLALVAAVLVTWRPDWPVVPGFLLLVGIWVYARGDLLGTVAAHTGGLLRLAALVLAVHLLTRVATLARHVPWRGLVEVPVLLRLLRSMAVVQVVVQALLLAAVWLRANLGLSAVGQEWLRFVAVAATVLVAVLVVPRSWVGGGPSRPQQVPHR